jgi:nitric oxide reductase NorE protein
MQRSAKADFAPGLSQFQNILVDDTIVSHKIHATPPGDLAIWFFIFAELLAFGIFFVAYAFARAHNVELFNESQQHLNRTSGAINTLVLITSSYFMVRAVAAIKQDSSRDCARWIAAAIGLGGVFLIIKLFEFHTKFSDGISLSTNTFYMFYLSLTIFHFMHVILGMVILTAVMLKAKADGYSAVNHTGVETGASYWHMVDLLWIILFPLVYVIH